MEQNHTTVTGPAEENTLSKCAARSLKSFKDDVSPMNFGRRIFLLLFYMEKSQSLGCVEIWAA